jgi:hypothetical protein
MGKWQEERNNAWMKHLRMNTELEKERSIQKVKNIEATKLPIYLPLFKVWLVISDLI